MSLLSIMSILENNKFQERKNCNHPIVFHPMGMICLVNVIMVTLVSKESPVSQVTLKSLSAICTIFSFLLRIFGHIFSLPFLKRESIIIWIRWIGKGNPLWTIVSGLLTRAPPPCCLSDNFWAVSCSPTGRKSKDPLLHQLVKQVKRSVSSDRRYWKFEKWKSEEKSAFTSHEKGKVKLKFFSLF